MDFGAMDTGRTPEQHAGTWPLGRALMTESTFCKLGIAMLLPLLLILGSCATPDRAATFASKAGAEQRITLPGPGLTLSGVLFPPAGARRARHPAIVLLHGCSGMLDARGRLSSNQRAWAERFAQWGFVALTLDSFSPRGAGSICPIPSAERPARPWEDRTADAYAALAWLVRRSDVDPQRIFVAGWSHGGSTVMGVVRPEAPGRLADGPRFRAAIAFYPGCPRPPALNNYRPTMPLLILHGEADDWVPAAPCVDLARHFADTPFIVRTLLYPGAHHGFDAPSNRLVFLPDVENPRAPGGRGAHAGGHEPSRAHAIQETRAYLSGFLSIPLPGPAR